VTVLAEDHPLKLLPSALDPQQLKILNGLRYAFDMADVSYRRLLVGLGLYGTGGDKQGDLMTHVLVDAWGFVDSVDRLRDIAEHGLGGLADDSEAELRPYRVIRNHVQHLRERLLDPKQALMVEWGTLSWFVLEDELGNGTIHAIVPGAMSKRPNVPLVNPAGRMLHGDLDLVQLSAFGDTVNLSDTYRFLTVMAERIAEILGPQFEGHAQAGAELHIELAVGPGSESPTE
jgi:hypothetical protein